MKQWSPDFRLETIFACSIGNRALFEMQGPHMVFRPAFCAF